MNPMKTFLQWTIIGLAGLGVLVAFFYAEEDLRGWHAWNQFKHEWEARGEKFDFASVVPAPVPDDQNFALTPLVSTSYGNLLTRDGKMIPYKDRDANFVDRLKMPVGHDDDDLSKGLGSREQNRMSNLKLLQEYYRTLAAKTNEFPILPRPQSPAQDVLLALSKYDSTIEELRQASQLPCSRYPLNYYDVVNPAAILLPHLAPLKGCASVLRERSIAELQNGQGDKALDDVKLALQLTDKIHSEPFLISHLVRIAMVGITLQPIWEGMAEHQWTDAQLTQLDLELAKLDFLADYKLAMRGELGSQGGIFDYLRHHPEQFPNMSSDGDLVNTSLPARILWHLVPGGWLYQNELHCARPMVELYLPLSDTNRGIISPAATRHADAAVESEARHRNLYNIAERMFLPSLGNAARRFAYGQESVDLARVAIALERYRLVHSEYPGSLDALAPRFIEQLPHDIVNGQPLQYRRTADGKFLLYSVGWNETDDGGQAAFTKNGAIDYSNGDWVWKN